jgi:hypothetical protein
LHIQEPVLQILRLGAFFIEKEIFFRRQTKNAIFEAELIVVDFELVNAVDLDGFKISTQFLLASYQKTMRFRSKQLGQGLVDAVAHSQKAPLSWRIGVGQISY